jgi:hAT family C-terminal dimerisation region
VEPAQRATHPELTTMALGILSISAMSDEPGRLFSGAGVTVAKRRSRLRLESIEALECSKPWDKGVIPCPDEN